jgi:hypothetical protein
MGSGNSLVKQVFELILSVRVTAFFVFILLNIYELDEVEYDIALPTFGSESGSFSFYSIIAILGIIFALVLIFSVGIFGIGFNTAGTYTILRYVSYIFLWIILGLGLTYYLQFEPAFSFVIEVVSTIVFVLYLLTTNVERSNGSDE